VVRRDEIAARHCHLGDAGTRVDTDGIRVPEEILGAPLDTREFHRRAKELCGERIVERRDLRQANHLRRPAR
jgi:hypothetical protein